ncbi:MAG: hypothetical protein A3F11_09180 [Gammaproteobacteria bacterium RIFCSPHIGHO2_12_FULL_37_14]|nr:MAG: hypothetical protein A3F11_09180 [Gammaproteobacteria bacterium RIFCSPHIGHO2_12_FULL_37_14]
MKFKKKGLSTIALGLIISLLAPTYLNAESTSGGDSTKIQGVSAPTIQRRECFGVNTAVITVTDSRVGNGGCDNYYCPYSIIQDPTPHSPTCMRTGFYSFNTSTAEYFGSLPSGCLYAPYVMYGRTKSGSKCQIYCVQISVTSVSPQSNCRWVND